MYSVKNKAMSLLECLLAISVISIVLTLLIIFLSSTSKINLKILKNYEREKKFSNFIYLIEDNINFKKNLDFRILNLSGSEIYLFFDEIFNKKSLRNGNTLILKSYSYDEAKKELKDLYFLIYFSKKDKISKVFIGAFNKKSIKLNESSELIEDCSGKILFEENFIHFVIKDEKKERKKIYEKILLPPKKF